MFVRRPPRDLDPNRIAVLPFRTSGADSSLAALHDGLVELLSIEFTGDVGPTAVDAGEVLRAWTRAGVDAQPTTRDGPPAGSRPPADRA